MSKLISHNSHTLIVPNFKFFDGSELENIRIGYQTHGTLNKEKSNAILVFHALTGSQNISGQFESNEGAFRWTQDCKEGWWSDFVGSGLAIDTDKYFVICANWLGGCYGSSGPSSIDPSTDQPYGSKFPQIRLIDIANTQKLLVDSFGIQKLHNVIGSSAGGLIALEFACKYPESLASLCLIACGVELTPLQIIHNLEQITAIKSDASFSLGDYYQSNFPESGLALARMIAHKTYVSLDAMSSRANSKVKDSDGSGLNLNHPIESYMVHQGKKFISRFDANTYLQFIQAWQLFNLSNEVQADTTLEALERLADLKVLVVSIDSDVCFYPEEQKRLVGLLSKAGVEVASLLVESDKGHDSFLIEPHLYADTFRNFLES